MEIGLLITQRCNAACTHCTTDSGPDRTRALSQASLFRIMEEAAALAGDDPLTFGISGGEPFLDFEHLLAIVRHARGLGGESTCVTNGYWASSDGKARAMLSALRQAGLARIAVSTSAFHQRFVKLARVQRALRTAVELGVGAVLKYATRPQDGAAVERLAQWGRDIGLLRVEAFPVMPYLREGASLPESAYATEPGLPDGPCPSPSLTVREDGTVYSCCAPGGFVTALSLGNAVGEGLKAPYRRFLLNGRQRLLRETGPIAFAEAIRQEGLGHRFRQRYVSVCDLCAHIASDPELNAVASVVAAAHEREYVLAAVGRHVC